jgi:hypothetical protein
MLPWPPYVRSTQLAVVTTQNTKKSQPQNSVGDLTQTGMSGTIMFEYGMRSLVKYG